MSSPLVITVGDELREALEEYCGANNYTLAEACRVAIAAYIGFDKPGLPNQRKSKYPDEESKKEALRIRSKEQRQSIKAELTTLRELARQIKEEKHD